MAGLRPVIAVVQARMGSTRLPGKALRPIRGIPLLAWVLRRVARASLLDGVVLAVPEGRADDRLARLGARLGCAVFRGAEADVLGRFVGAARATGAKVVVRVCADNPFIWGGEVDRLIRHFQRLRPDYAFNHMPRLGNGYPDGLGAEILRATLLEEVHREAKRPEHREHVTLFLWDHPRRYRISAVRAPRTLVGPEVKLDVDTPADLQRMRGLAARFPRSLPVEGIGPEMILAAYRRLMGGPRAARREALACA